MNRYLCILWDIQNVNIPTRMSPQLICSKIRELPFAKECYEKCFVVVCDAKTENNENLDKLNEAQVDVMHVSSNSKNTADMKIKVVLKRFIRDFRSHPLRIILLTGDKDFCTDLHDLRNEENLKIEVLLIHPQMCSEGLKSFAHQTMDFDYLVRDIPVQTEHFLKITNLPSTIEDQEWKIDSYRTLTNMANQYQADLVEWVPENGHAILKFYKNTDAREFKESSASHLFGKRQIQISSHKDLPRNNHVTSFTNHLERGYRSVSNPRIPNSEVQYTDKIIKSIVEFLGPNLSPEVIRSIWSLGEEDSSHVMDNVHSILANAASRFDLTQFELINQLIKEKWRKCGSRIKEKLIHLVGQIGKESVQAKQVNPVNSVLALLWEMAHSPDITRHLVELALKEHLNILSDLKLNVDATLRQYIFKCVEYIKKDDQVKLPFVKHLHDICKSYGSKSSKEHKKASKQIVWDLNRNNEIVKLISVSLNKAHKQAVRAARLQEAPLKADTLVDNMYSHEESVQIHLQLMLLLLKDGDLYLSWARCKELWDTLITNENSIQTDQDLLFTWFTECISDLELETQKQLFQEKLLSLPPSSVSHNSLTCLQKYFEATNSTEDILKASFVGDTVEKTDLRGMDYFWDIVIDCDQDNIAERAMELILNYTYLSVDPRLKNEPQKLHCSFIQTCFQKLETSWAERENCQLATSQGIELDISREDLEKKALKIRRMLHLAEKYVSSVEVRFNGKQSIQPLALNFYGRPVVKDDDVEIMEDEDEDDIPKVMVEGEEVDITDITPAHISCMTREEEEHYNQVYVEFFKEID